MHNASLLIDRNLDAGRADKVALRHGETETTYGELAQLVNKVGNFLKDSGVRRDDRVLMVMDDSAAFPATFLGAIRIGAVPVPVNPMDRPDNYAYYVEDSYARLVVGDAALRERVEIDGAEILQDILEHAASASAELDPAPTHRDDMAFWLYSSGSTGRPKGVVHLHHDIEVTCETYASQVLQIAEQDICFSTTKLFHAYGLGNGLSFPFSVGATAVLNSGRPAPDAIFAAVERHRPTLFFSVPALYAAMLKAGAEQHDFGSVRACVSAAEALPAAIFERWRQATGRVILDGIGSTEMLHIYCSNTLADINPGTSGKPVPGYELRIVDEQGGEVTEPGAAGDLLVKGDSCAAYYWHQHDKTKHCMRGDWFYTGDRYIRTEDGNYVYQGRADDMIKVGGLWVSPADVEACLVRHPAVSEAAVIGVSIEDISRIKAFVITAQPVDADELRTWCKDNLRRYEYPHVVEFVDDFPRTPTGKIQRFKLREAEAAQPA